MTSAPTNASPQPAGKGIHIGLWVVQALLAIGFGMAGAMKLATPYAELAAQQPWAKQTPEALVTFIGVVEVLGALGVILPAATRIQPWLTPLASAGFVVIMILGGMLHISIGEPAIPNVALGLLAAFVAWGRFKRAPIAKR